VTGTVKYRGTPVPQGVLVTFVTPDGAGRQGETDADGRYAVQKLPVGALRVTVTRFVEPLQSLTGGKRLPPGMPIRTPFGVVRISPEANPPPAAALRIPEKYRTAAATPLGLTLKRGEQTFDIDLEE
jgi:hypothetical protein